MGFDWLEFSCAHPFVIIVIAAISIIITIIIIPIIMDMSHPARHVIAEYLAADFISSYLMMMHSFYFFKSFSLGKPFQKNFSESI